MCIQDPTPKPQIGWLEEVDMRTAVPKNVQQLNMCHMFCFSIRGVCLQTSLQYLGDACDRRQSHDSSLRVEHPQSRHPHNVTTMISQEQSTHRVNMGEPRFASCVTLPCPRMQAPTATATRGGEKCRTDAGPWRRCGRSSCS